MASIEQYRLIKHSGTFKNSNEKWERLNLHQVTVDAKTDTILFWNKSPFIIAGSSAIECERLHREVLEAFALPVLELSIDNQLIHATSC